MAKRSWSEAIAGADPEEALPPPPPPPPARLSSSVGEIPPSRPLTSPSVHGVSVSPGVAAGPSPLANQDGALQQRHVPLISRKVKACAACRKQKIKCIMDERGPPCRRCTDRNLSCVLNKSLQTLISERSQTTELLAQDLEMVYSSLQTVLENLNLPPLSRLHSSLRTIPSPNSDLPSDLRAHDEVGPSCDNSPKVSPEDENDLPKVPIHSVYHLTKLSALRSPDAADVDSHPRQLGDAVDDLITRGSLSLEDAERLFHLYTGHLDAYMYGIGLGHVKGISLDQLRRRSRILAAVVFTVAAMHDPQSNAIYGVCSREFRRLMAASIFDRRIDRDFLRALCIGSYWLSDISWMVSGYAIRRAAEFNAPSQFRRVIFENNEDAADYLRLWYILYVCDQHLSTLYARPSVLKEDDAINGWESFMQYSGATSEDKRLVSQVALLKIIHDVRELFGPDTGEPVPKVYLTQITNFSRQLDQWVGRWSTSLSEHHGIGNFPRKGVVLHFHFAKLHLYAHVFRGLRNSTIPSHFLDAASAAVSAATAILNMLLTDPDVHHGLAGLPTYLHSMTAFACMFLAKLTMIHGDELIERATFLDLTSQLIALYRSTPVGKWHLVHLMADGLDKICDTIRRSTHSIPRTISTPLQHQHQQSTSNNNNGLVGPGGAVVGTFDPRMSHQGTTPADVSSSHLMDPIFSVDAGMDLDTNFLLDYNMSLGASQLMYLSNGTLDLNDPSQNFM